jgi:hypothetical protein
MNSKEITEVIKLLSEETVHSACHVTTFVGYHKDKDGTEKKVTITISDRGEKSPEEKSGYPRFVANASWEGGQSFRDGEGKTLAEAVRSIFYSWDQQPAAPVVVVNPIVNFINPDNQQKPAGSTTGPA